MAERTTVPCSSCGLPRDISVRQLSRRRREGKDNGLCSLCRAHPNIEITVREQAFWLERFSDEEIAVLASGIAGRKVSVQHVQDMWPRERLLGRKK